MQILGLSNQSSGCGYHRILLPLAYMQGVKAYVTNWITEDKMEGWDVINYNRLCPYDGDWSGFRKLMNYPKIVMDIDDYWILPPNHINAIQYAGHTPKIIANIQDADAVTTTNARLAEKVYKYNKNVYILPNALPYGVNQFHDGKIESDKTRVIWVGGSSHTADIELLRNPLKKMRGQNVQMVVGGYTNTDEYSRLIWDRMASSLTAGGQLDHIKLPGRMPTDYMDLYQFGDIALIPLEQSEWHACKSNLKLLEAAAKNIPCIVSNVEPYNNDYDCPAFFVNSQKDWARFLTMLINDKNLIYEYGKALKAWAEQSYNYESINHQRYNIFTNLCQAQALL